MGKFGKSAGHQHEGFSQKHLAYLHQLAAGRRSKLSSGDGIEGGGTAVT